MQSLNRLNLARSPLVQN
jgi:hypothetical protein